MSASGSGEQLTNSIGVKVSTIFVFSSPAVQTAANAIYENNKAREAAGVNFQFKTDYERMQYLLGKYGRTTNAPSTGS
jgi:hypothetical protein